MTYNYTGDLCFSRELTEEELDEVVSIIGFTDDEVNVEFDNNSISIDASQHGGRTYEFCYLLLTSSCNPISLRSSSVAPRLSSTPLI